MRDEIKTKCPYLYDFQVDGVMQLLNGKKLLSDEVGLGKTVTTIAYINIKDYKKVLIVCPVALKKQWQNEIKKFMLKNSVMLQGNKKQRNEILINNPDILIVNYEQLRNNESLLKYKYDIIVFDEVHRLKNKATKTFKTSQKLKSDDKIGLTATPFVNKPEELHTICNFLWNFIPWWQFSKKFCEWDKLWLRNNQQINVIVGYKNLKILHNLLNIRMIRRFKKDVMKQLPKRIYKNYFIEPSHEQQLIINYYERAIKFDDNPTNILANLTMARMACDSTELIAESNSDKAIDIKFIESAKIKQLKEIVSICNGKILCFTQWSKMADILHKEFSESNLITGDTKDKNEVIENFKTNGNKLLFATDCLSYGTNLQFISNLVHFDLPWSSAKIEQREGRVDRINQQNNMLIFKLLISNSIEDRVVDLLTYKQSLFNQIVEGKNMIELIKEVFKK